MVTGRGERRQEGKGKEKEQKKKKGRNGGEGRKFQSLVLAQVPLFAKVIRARTPVMEGR